MTFWPGLSLVPGDVGKRVPKSKFRNLIHILNAVNYISNYFEKKVEFNHDSFAAQERVLIE